MKKKTIIHFGNCSDVGRVRSDNQDFLGKFPENGGDAPSPRGQLFVVADGMGGHKAGREASSLAVNTIGHEYYSAPTESIPESLQHAFQAANDKIHSQSAISAKYSGMGTTCTALVLKDDHAYIGHIGDSRVYRISKENIVQLTNDHSNVAEMQRRGMITKEEAKYHPERSLLYRALGSRAVAEIDIIDDIDLGADEYFLMCTDGLFNHVEDEEMKTVVLGNDPQKASEVLVELSNDRGGTDNITVQVVHVKSSDQNHR